MAEGQFSHEAEVIILAGSCSGRIDTRRANIIEQALHNEEAAAEFKAEPAKAAAAEVENAALKAEPAKETPTWDAEANAILDGPPPAVPPPAPIAPPTDFALAKFDKAISALKELRTKSVAQFAKTTHSLDELVDVVNFIELIKQEMEQTK